MSQYYTEYIREMTSKEVEDIEKDIGTTCDKCGKHESNKWFIRKFYFDGIPAYHCLCEDCKGELI